jgi:transcriptional antiterminator Rof (Rho-off)
MTCGYLTWVLAADSYLLKLQHLQNKFLRPIENFQRCTTLCDLHTAFNLPCAYHYITKLCKQEAEVIQIHENGHIRSTAEGQVSHRKYMRLKVGSGEAYDRLSD